MVFLLFSSRLILIKKPHEQNHAAFFRFYLSIGLCKTISFFAGFPQNTHVRKNLIVIKGHTARGDARLSLMASSHSRQPHHIAFTKPCPAQFLLKFFKIRRLECMRIPEFPRHFKHVGVDLIQKIGNRIGYPLPWAR